MNNLLEEEFFSRAAILQAYAGNMIVGSRPYTWHSQSGLIKMPINGRTVYYGFVQSGSDVNITIKVKGVNHILTAAMQKSKVFFDDLDVGAAASLQFVGFAYTLDSNILTPDDVPSDSPIPGGMFWLVPEGHSGAVPGTDPGWSSTTFGMGETFPYDMTTTTKVFLYVTRHSTGGIIWGSSTEEFFPQVNPINILTNDAAGINAALYEFFTNELTTNFGEDWRGNYSTMISGNESEKWDLWEDGTEFTIVSSNDHPFYGLTSEMALVVAGGGGFERRDWHIILAP